MALRRNCSFIVVGTVVVLLGLGGCSGNRSLEPDGLPGDEFLVGGGMMIDWEAPSAGTAYLVEKETGRIIETRSLDAGDRFSFSLGSASQVESFEEVIGINFSSARLLLYFQPIETTNTTE